MISIQEICESYSLLFPLDLLKEDNEVVVYFEVVSNYTFN